MSAVIARPSNGHLMVLFAVSASMLAFEILLVRLFEFSHWHYFAGLAVSLALLGLGTAGTWLALRGGGHADRFGDLLLLAGAAIQAGGTLIVLYVHSFIALRPLFAAWEGRELARLLLVDFAAFIPFLGAGLVIGGIFARWPGASPSIYATNLLGSGLGSIAASASLAVMDVERGLALTALLPALALTAFMIGHRRFQAATLPAIVLCLAVVISPPEPASSDFKTLSRVLDLPDARTLYVQSGLPGKLNLVRSESLRIAPGLSLEWTEPVPAVDAAIIGSDRLVPVPHRFPAKRPHTEASLGGLPFRLRPTGQGLILGTSAWQSQLAGTGREIVWVEPDERLLNLARERGFSGASGILVADSAYRYLATTTRRFTLVAIDAAFGGGDAATEDYLMTTEGLAAVLRILKPEGLLVLPLKLSLPPRRTPRALATLKAALESQGVERPARHVAALRGLQEIVLLASPQPLDPRDLSEIRAFAERWRFDLAWLPDLDESETDRYHRLAEPVFYLTAKALFDGSPLPEAVRWFSNVPADFTRPYFWRSMEWRRVPDFVQALGRERAASYLDWTLLLTALTAGLSTVLAFLLIVLPLGRLPSVAPPYSRTTIAIYFTMLGLGYLLLELVFFQRAILFLGEPVATASVVFAIFLLGSGAGSVIVPRPAAVSQPKRIFLPIAAALAASVVILWYFPDALLELSLFTRTTVIGLAIAPLAWSLGRPFPWALRQLAGQPCWVPWAWGINGFASVVAASLATLISVEWGQPLTLGVAVVCYTVAGLTALRWFTTR